MTLDELRKELEQIDAKLFALFSKRMDISEQIAEIKKAEGLALFQPEREKELLARIASLVPLRFYNYSVSLYKYIMELGKTRQREIFSSDTYNNNALSQLISNTKAELKNPRITVQGVKGSFAMSAAVSMYPKGRISYVDSWEDVLYAVEDGSCDYGVLPVENSSAGSVIEVYDLLIKYKHYIVKALPLSVNQCLLGVRGAKIADIRRVYSHPHAFPQCEDFLRRHHKLQRYPTSNTALAAEFVAREGKIENAAIASRECAHIYGLDILTESIQQSDTNTTRFISVSKRLEIPANANKISVVFTLPHVTGSLYRTLSRFALNGLNLTKLESRPNALKNFEYYFYLDFTGKVSFDPILDLLNSLSEELPVFSFLGNYNEP